MAVRLGQNFSQPVGPGSTLCRAIYFYDFTDICQRYQWFPWHSVWDNRILTRKVRVRISAFTYIYKSFSNSSVMK